MAAAIPSTEPTSFVSGDTIAWTKSLTDYPATDGWTLQYAFRLENGGGKLNVTATTSGSDYAASITATDSGLMQPGEWIWAAYVSLSGARYQVDSGRVTVTPNLLAIDSSVDLRSSARKAYDNALEAWETFSKSKLVTLNGRTYTARDAADLILYVDRCKADYQSEVQASQFANTGIDPRKIKVRFSRV